MHHETSQASIQKTMDHSTLNLVRVKNHISHLSHQLFMKKKQEILDGMLNVLMVCY